MVVSRLNVKLIRDIRFSPYLFAGVAFLLLVGIALFVGTYELYLNLQSSYALSYRLLNLSDFTIPVQSAPTEIVSTLQRIPGVRNVEGRVIQEVEIEQPESQSRKVIGRIISIPDSGTPAVNQLKVIRGIYPRLDTREILLESSFAEYHDYKPGDTLEIVVQGDNVRFRISGIVQSPEYIYVVRGREYPMPTPRTFGVMWMRKSVVDDLFGTSGAVNEVLFTMVPGANRSTAIRLAEQLLRPFGAGEVVPQEDQASEELLRSDLNGLRTLAFFFPILFLTISSLSVYNMLSRMVYAQRSQIGFLRAAGFSRRAVGVHYVLFASIVGISGSLLGGIAGHFMGVWITGWYTTFIQVPYYDTSPKWEVMITGFALAVLVTVAAGLMPAIGASRLTPAEAIGSEAPVSGRAPVLENYLTFLRKFSLLARLPLRNFLRNPKRTIATVAGIASGATLLLVSTSLLDSSVAAIDFYFENSVRYDIMASFLYPQNQFVMQQIERWPGVMRAEPVLAVPAKLVKGNEDQTILIYGIVPGSRLMAPSSREGERIPVQSTGLMVTGSTADRLGLQEGSIIRLTLPKQVVADTEIEPAGRTISPIGQLAPLIAQQSFRESIFSLSRGLLEADLDRVVRVSSITYQPIGTAAYASIGQIRTWYGSALELPPNAINAVAIEIDPVYTVGIERRLYNMDGIASVEVTRYIRQEVDDQLEQSRVFFNIMLTFSVALAGVIIFNSTLMNVIERTREIATLRTVGLSAGAAARMIWVENLLAYIVGIAVGVPFGTWLAGFFVQAYETESFSMQKVIFTRTYLITILAILITIAMAQIPGIRYIRRIELAKATKDIG